MFYAVIIAIASIFYYIGNHEFYEKGWRLAILSVVLSFVASALIPFGLLSAIGINVLFYTGILIYNIVSKKPPGSRSGF